MDNIEKKVDITATDQPGGRESRIDSRALCQKIAESVSEGLSDRAGLFQASMSMEIVYQVGNQGSVVTQGQRSLSRLAKQDFE